MQYTGVDNMAISVFDKILIQCIGMGYMEWQNLQNYGELSVEMFCVPVEGRVVDNMDGYLELHTSVL